MTFIDAFKIWVGKTECPEVYLEWAAMSLLAAACGNHIYIPYRRGYIDTQVFPNLYLILIGPTGAGKSYALGQARKLMEMVVEAEEEHGRRNLNIYHGYITHSGLYDELSAKKKQKMPDGTMQTIALPWKGQLYLLHDELAQCVGTQDNAEMIVRALTGLSRGNDAFDDQTRTNGRVHVENFMINWFATTNIDWLLASISPNTMNAGFFRRTILVTAPPSTERIPPNSGEARPPNWTAIQNGLARRLATLLNTTKAVPLTKEAQEIDTAWYLSLQNPSADEHGMGVVSGRHDLSLKLALILALACDEWIISAERLAEAQDLTKSVINMQREIMPLIRKGEIGTPSEHILQFILQKDGNIAHARVARYAYDKWAIEAKRFDELVRTWLEGGLVKSQRKNGQLYYRGIL